MKCSSKTCKREARSGLRLCESCARSKREYNTRNNAVLTPKRKAYHARYNARLREQVLALLGGKCSWDGCTWTDSRALQIDHKHGGGYKEASYGPTFLRKVLAVNGEGFQLLCANHNWIKKVEQGEVRGSLGIKNPETD